ncbi:MAG: hypothetical protein KF823_05415 [Xanthomonadales bacterium]|nr:hypothetical protein [Xanthomonadales bacterium]
MKPVRMPSLSSTALLAALCCAHAAAQGNSPASRLVGASAVDVAIGPCGEVANTRIAPDSVK